MKPRIYLALWALGLALVLLAAAFQSVPGYMDAEYYYAGGLRLAEGSGFSEPFLWNYLNDPVGLPTPSHTYWMPLASILAALGMVLTQSGGYLAARLFFFLLASLLPPFTAWFGWRLVNRERSAVLAGLLAGFSGFYAIYTGLTETFTPYMLLGGLFILAAFERESKWLDRGPVPWRYALLGVLAGLMHMARADGLLWLAAALLLAFIWCRSQADQGIRARMKRSSLLLFFCLAGYALVSFPWYARNLSLYRSMLPPGNGRAIWITDYDQTFNYPADTLTPENWLAAGLGEHARARWDALGMNLSTVLAVEGSVFLLPLILAGLWRLRSDRRVQLAILMWGLTFLVMTLVFPYAGARGGFLHSGAAIQPLLWAAAPVGLLALVEWGARKRGWKKKSAETGLGGIIVALAALFTLGVFVLRVIAPVEGGWNANDTNYMEIDRALTAFGALDDRLVMVNNPPGYFVASGHRAIVIPNGDAQTLLTAGRRYGADYVVLEKSVVRGLADLYTHPADQPGLNYLGEVDGVQFFRIEP